MESPSNTLSPFHHRPRPILTVSDARKLLVTMAIALPNTVFRGQTKMKYYIDQQSSMLKIVESLFGS